MGRQQVARVRQPLDRIGPPNPTRRSAQPRASPGVGAGRQQLVGLFSNQGLTPPGYVLTPHPGLGEEPSAHSFNGIALKRASIWADPTKVRCYSGTPAGLP